MSKSDNQEKTNARARKICAEINFKDYILTDKNGDVYFVGTYAEANLFVIELEKQCQTTE